MHIPLEIQNKQLYFEGSAAAAAPAESADARSGLSAKLVGFADAVRRGTGPPGGGRDAQLAVSVLEEVPPSPPSTPTHPNPPLYVCGGGHRQRDSWCVCDVGSPAPTCALGALSWVHVACCGFCHVSYMQLKSLLHQRPGPADRAGEWPDVRLKGTVVCSPSSQHTLL